MEKRGLCHKTEGEAGSPSRQDRCRRVLGVGVLDREATRFPDCACMLEQNHDRGNLVFTLISCQVFPLGGC
jgi:hypothetical protein